jgi:hypothetical protein
MGMTTFTLRSSGSLAEHLSSAKMRRCIAEFLDRPHALPPDPGPGEDRISLTLPGESVRGLAGFLRCSPSEALRRLALEAIQPSPAVLAAQGELQDRHGSWSPPEASPRASSENGSQDLVPMTGQQIMGLIVSALIPLLSFAVLFFLSFRKGKKPNGSMTT